MPTIEARLTINPRRAIDMLREHRRLVRASRAIPKPVPWEWAKPRLMPLLAGPYLGQDPLVTVVGEPGCAVVFGIEVDRTYMVVDRPVSERWEVSDAQLEGSAQANLRRRAGRIDATSLTHGTISGRIVRVLETVPWASSLLLEHAELVRVFGHDDQVFAAPKRETLLSFTPEAPPHVIAQIVEDYEHRAAWPLLLDPFFLSEGRLVWQEAEEGEGWVADP